MVIEFLDECDSTHILMCNSIREGSIKPPSAICAKNQPNGIGSRGNSWSGLGGNLFLSFCLDKTALPSDLNDASVSIYFAMIMKIYLQNLGSKVWVKWPNDLYIDSLKIGGVISTKISNTYIGSVGLNILNAPENSAILDIKTNANDVAFGFLNELEKKFSWKQIFSKFSVEFVKSKSFITHINDQNVHLADATLCEDGAILLNDKKVYSLR
ncbi:biotin--[acetyl-CoA-carboxylase] ligase [Campylobacter mucosalis]|uniref:biotin--[acetyl-CoA-carboxylase] ligase n=1 Tax=Campylobacter mucosalis TaxID=202 RepID=UPI00147018E8|nr:biotin--[acetyl-CoA-carboxylase] ligase [Campylobacter mucosalis]